jgi:hypothetical protein
MKGYGKPRGREIALTILLAQPLKGMELSSNILHGEAYGIGARPVAAT